MGGGSHEWPPLGPANLVEERGERIASSFLFLFLSSFPEFLYPLRYELLQKICEDEVDADGALHLHAGSRSSASTTTNLR